MNILIKDTMIITMDEEKDIIDRGYILIKGKNIEEVSQGEYKGNLRNLNVINGENYCVMPGLVNCHTHSSMTLLRGYGEGLPLMRWLNEKIWPMEAKFTEKHIKVGAELAFIEMIRSGTTTFNDMYFMQHVILDSAKEVGIRGVLGLPIIGEEWEKQLKNSVDLVAKLEKEKCDTVKTMFAPHSPYMLTYPALKEIASVAKKEEIGIHTHIAETLDEIKIIKDKHNMTPCELLLKAGILENNVVAAHCVHLSDEDMNIIKDKGVSPVYNPQSNMKLASGIARVGEMLDKGINVCLGTDGTSSNNNLNMFEEMETGALLQKLKYNDATKLDGKTMLKMATVNGAKALNFENLGLIREGFKADMIMINLNKPNMVPRYDMYSNVVFSANGSEVEYVIIDGNMIMEKGEFVNIDEEKVLYQCNNLCKELIY